MTRNKVTRRLGPCKFVCAAGVVACSFNGCQNTAPSTSSKVASYAAPVNTICSHSTPLSVPETLVSDIPLHESIVAQVNCNSFARLVPADGITHDSLEEVEVLPSYDEVKSLGGGSQGYVDQVILPGGAHAALKCSWKKGHPLLNGYGHLLDGLPSPFSPRVYGYFKFRKSRDCYFMELTGPRIDQIREAYGTVGVWPARTIGSIGLQLIDAMKHFHTVTEVAHKDPFPGNIAIGRDDAANGLSSRIMFINFEQAQSVDNPLPVTYADMRQVLVSLRYLVDGDRKMFWKINSLAGQCLPNHTMQNCLPAPKPLCDALLYVCELRNTPVDYEKLFNFMKQMIHDDGGEYRGQIIWTNDVVNKVKNNLPPN